MFIAHRLKQMSKTFVDCSKPQVFSLFSPLIYPAYIHVQYLKNTMKTTVCVKSVLLHLYRFRQ